MLEYLKVSNIALIDEIEVEFGRGLNLLTGETGSGKSIIVDSLGMLTGARASADLIKDGCDSARVEGVFRLIPDGGLRAHFTELGIEIADNEETELIVTRELSASGRNRVFINGRLITQNALKNIGARLVVIHGQGEHATLYDTSSHLELLDAFADVMDERRHTSEAFEAFQAVTRELEGLRSDEAEKLQLLDILNFQIEEIQKAGLAEGEDEDLAEEKLRLNNVEKLSSLSREAFGLLYDDDNSASATLEKASRRIEELSVFDKRFAEYLDELRSASAVINDLATTTRNFNGELEFSPDRLEQIESRLNDIAMLTRKYGGSIRSVLEHLDACLRRRENIETSELREKELKVKAENSWNGYIDAALGLHEKRSNAAERFAKLVVAELRTVALDKARFVVDVRSPSKEELAISNFAGCSATGIDDVEFLFSANPGEQPKPLARVASGGEASRLMLILRTTANEGSNDSAAVFDEIDAGIGGRVAEAVGLKLKELAKQQQVLCVTHQAQVASKADKHFVVEKHVKKGRTSINVRELNAAERVEEIARMLAGETITDAARENAREMIASAR
ncbi:MAG TPA: DNA repair protein RecN [Pyrinomonadaceae bacterium]|nr:DNA repair protein RecN [Pyrinomonadaceae bacterium]